MYIVPNSTLRILRNVPINEDYIHTLYFSSLQKQTDYFSGKTKFTEVGNYYINKDNLNEIQVERTTADLLDCNYIMFKNNSHENKWIYAFIKEVRYKNEDSSIIVFEIDELQTWFIEMTLKECFIERQHTTTDDKGEHRIPENLEQGEYVFREIANTKTETTRLDMVVVVLATFNKYFEDSQGQFNTSNTSTHEGMYTGLSTIVLKEWYDGTSYNPKKPTVKAFFAMLNGEKAHLQDGIVGVYMMPSAYARDTEIYDGVDNRGTTIYENELYSLNTIETYTPRNRKLLTNPYVKFLVTDGLSGAIEYNYEDFENGIPSFRIDGLATGKPEIRLVPLKYKGLEVNLNESFYLSNLPTVAYNTDSFKAWLAQNTMSMATGFATTTLGSGIGIAGSLAMLSNPATMPMGVAGLAGSVVNLGSAVLGSVTRTYEASLMPKRSGGSQSYGATSVYQGEFGFRFYSVTCREEFAKIIDSYFDMFGYKINRVQVPDLKARQYYTYIKTKGATILGQMPSDSARKIREIFDRGVTFWNIVACEQISATVGDYSRLRFGNVVMEGQ